VARLADKASALRQLNRIWNQSIGVCSRRRRFNRRLLLCAAATAAAAAAAAVVGEAMIAPASDLDSATQLRPITRLAFVNFRRRGRVILPLQLLRFQHSLTL